MIKMPKIATKLDALRIKAKSLYEVGFRDDALELMRISRGEVKIEVGCKLFGLTASDTQKAKSCTLAQRLILAANKVDNERYGVTEDDYAGAIERKIKNRWPVGMKKNSVIDAVANKNSLSPSSLSRVMKGEDWQTKVPGFHNPDWHPDHYDKLFGKPIRVKK